MFQYPKHFLADTHRQIRFSSTCKDWYENALPYTSHLEISRGPPEAELKPIYFQITRLLERIDHSRIKSAVLNHEMMSATVFLPKEGEDLGFEHDEFWMYTRYMKNMTRLESLTFLHNPTVDFFQRCSIFVALTQLKIEVSWMDGSGSDQAFMKHITCLTALRTLSLSFGHMAVATVRPLEELPNLEKLHLSCTVSSPSRLTQLRSLSVDVISESTKTDIITMTNLMTVIAPNWNVYEPIKNMQNLEYLAAKSIRVTYLPPNLTYLCTPWSFVLTPWLTQLHSYEGELHNRTQLNLFNANRNITHLALTASGFNYSMLTMLTGIKSLSFGLTPVQAFYPTDLLLKTIGKMTSLRRIEFVVANDVTSFDIAAKFPLKNVTINVRKHSGPNRSATSI